MTGLRPTQATLSPHAGPLTLHPPSASAAYAFRRPPELQTSTDLRQPIHPQTLHGARQTQHASRPTSLPPLSPSCRTTENTLSAPFNPTLRRDTQRELPRLHSPSASQFAPPLSYARTRFSPGPRASFSGVDLPGHLPQRPPELYLPSPSAGNNGYRTSSGDEATRPFPWRSSQAQLPHIHAPPCDQMERDEGKQLPAVSSTAGETPSLGNGRQREPQSALYYPHAPGSRAEGDSPIASQRSTRKRKASQMSSPLASPVVKAPRMDMDPKARKRLEQQNIRFITNYWVDKIRLILAVDHTLSKNKTLKQIAIELRENHVLIKRLEDQSADLSMQIDARDGLLQSLRNQLSEKDEAIRALNVELDAFRAVLEKVNSKRGSWQQSLAKLLNTPSLKDSNNNP